MSELRWWLLDGNGGMRASLDGIRFDIVETGADDKFLVYCCEQAHYGPHKRFDTVFEAMRWAEEYYASLTNPMHEDEER